MDLDIDNKEQSGKSDNINNSLDDIVFNDNDKTAKTKKIIFWSIIVAVLGIIIYFTISTLFSDSNLPDNSENLDFLEDSKEDTFFMDSPVDALEENSDNSIEKLEEDTSLSKDALLNNSESSSDNQTETDSETPEIETTTPSPIVVPEKPKVVSETNTTKKREYFIQTVTLLRMKKPNKKFLKSIEDLGFSYHIDTYTSKDRNITRILVGPFSDKKGANEVAEIIREKVIKDAFVVKTKLH